VLKVGFDWFNYWIEDCSGWLHHQPTKTEMTARLLAKMKSGGE
jgi:hypothetical protein